MAFYKVNPGDIPFPTDVNQYADALTGNNDIGAITLAPNLSPPPAPTAAVAAGSALSVGQYQYCVTFVTGYKKTNGTLVYNGETALSPATTVTTTSGNQVVNLSNIATSNAPYVVARRIYRTQVNGSTFYKVAEIPDNSTTTFTDNIPDSSLTVTAPTTNTTGTYFTTVYVGPDQRGQLIADGNTMVHLRNAKGLTFVESKLNLYLMSNAYYDGTNFNRIDTTQPAAAIVIQNNGQPQFRSIGPGANPINWNVFNIFHEGNFATRTHVEAYLSTTQSLTNNSWNRIKFDTILYDYLSEFSTTSGNWYFTATNTGIYMFSVGVRVENLNPGYSTLTLGTHLLNMSGNYYNLNTHMPATNNTVMELTGTQVLYLSGGTQVEFRVYYSDTTQTATLAPGNNYTWLNITRVA